MQQLSKACAQCGKVFYKNPAHSMKVWNERVKYCSRQCYGAAKRRIPPDAELRPLLYDLYWNKEMSVGQIANRFNIHPESLREHFGRLDIPQRNPKEIAQILPQCQSHPLPICEVCGNTCRRHGRRFCSRECKVAWYRAEQVYNYRGPDRIDFYASTFWYARADEIRQRDKVCQHCGKTPEENGRSLDVHHIIPRSVREDHSPDNLIALCVSCHAKADAKLKNSPGN